MNTISPRSDIASVNVRFVVAGSKTRSIVNVPSTRASASRKELISDRMLDVGSMR